VLPAPNNGDGIAGEKNLATEEDNATEVFSTSAIYADETVCAKDEDTVADNECAADQGESFIVTSLSRAGRGCRRLRTQASGRGRDR